MAGKLAAVLAALVVLGASLIVIGAFLWIDGSSTVPRPTAYAGTSVFHDQTTPATILNVSRTVTFTFGLVTDQPWPSQGVADWSATLAANAGSAVSRIQIGDIVLFLCDPQCTNSHFVYDDIESLNQTAPFQWETYPGTPHVLTGLRGGSPVYVTYSLAMTVFYADGNYSGGGWWSNLYFGPMATVPDNAGTGVAVLSWGFILFLPSSVVVLLQEVQRRRFEW